jgi:hypothetical protein
MSPYPGLLLRGHFVAVVQALSLLNNREANPLQLRGFVGLLRCGVDQAAGGLGLGGGV